MTHDIFAVGASAGGLDPLQKIVSGLPTDLKATLFVVLHTSPDSPGYIADILSRAGKLPAEFPENDQKIEQGKIYVAPPDFHLVLEGQKMRLIRGPRENRHRPSIDTLFRSAALSFGPRVVGIILSGMLDDGVAGLEAIKECGGMALVQDPQDALCSSMPEHALRSLAVDHCVPSAQIAQLIEMLSKSKVQTNGRGKKLKSIEAEVQMASGLLEGEGLLDAIGKRSTLTCPECHGALWEVEDEKLLRFRCHIGHSYTAESLSAEQTDAIQKALSIAIRTLEDHASLTGKLAKQSAEEGREFSRRLFEDRHKQAIHHASVLREIMMKDGAPPLRGTDSS